jgi:hypothetical protein
MKVKCVICVLLALLAAAVASGAGFELRTWSTTAAAPADGSSHSTSANFEMVSRLGGSFVGTAESASFSLWGCSVTPVEGAFVATETEPLTVTLRWTVESFGGISGFNIYRAWAEDGPFERLNEEELPPFSPGVYEDTTVWPGSSFWYELRGVLGDGSEDVVGETVMFRTDGTLATKLYNANPNPFSDGTVIQLDVASASRGISLRIYDITGRVVTALNTEVARPGRHSVTWDGTNDRGQRVASGVYFIALEAAGVRETGRLVYLR